jgi:type I restriction enzyme M protein
VLDEFKTAGVFVNWWQGIRYDLKTIIAIGWSHVLIPDSYLIEAFFKTEAQEIEDLQGRLSEAETELDEAVETVDYEPDEDENVTAAVIKKHLQAMLDDLKDTKGELAAKERKAYQDQLDTIKRHEATVSKIKKSIKTKEFELEIKLSLKRIGADAEKAGIQLLIAQANEQIKQLDAKNADDNKKAKALEKDKKTLEERLSRVDELMRAIGQQITAAECKSLILKKLHDLVDTELARYLNAEKRALIRIVENLWDKYAMSSAELESAQERVVTELHGYLGKLGYIQ